MAQINKKQIIALRTAASKVFSDAEYREFLAANFEGVCSTKDLDRQQARQAIGLLRGQCGYSPRSALSGTPPSKGDFNRAYGTGKKGRSGNRITPAQAEKIAALCELLGWDVARGRLLKFIERQTGQKSAVQMLLNYQASKLIIGMQKVIAGGDKGLYKFLNTLTAADMENAGVLETLDHIKRKLAK